MIFHPNKLRRNGQVYETPLGRLLEKLRGHIASRYFPCLRWDEMNSSGAKYRTRPSGWLLYPLRGVIAIILEGCANRYHPRCRKVISTQRHIGIHDQTSQQDGTAEIAIRYRHVGTSSVALIGI